MANKILNLASEDWKNSKHKAVWDWLSASNLMQKLYFVFAEDDDGDVVITPDSLILPTSTTTESIITSYIDRTFLKVYDFVVSVFLPHTIDGLGGANIEYAAIVEALARWVEQQNEEKNFPLFGEGYVFEKVEVLALPEGIAASDEEGAKYMFGVRFEYRDLTQRKTL